MGQVWKIPRIVCITVTPVIPPLSNKIGSHFRPEDGASDIGLALGALYHHPNSKQNPFHAKAIATLPYPKQALNPTALKYNVVRAHKMQAIFFITQR